MKRAIRDAALAALVLATITGCSVQVDGEDAVEHTFGSDYFGAGGALNLTDPVAGDAFLAGGRVAVASEVQGDLVAAGGEVSVGGAVKDDLYAAGGTVQVDALVDGNARVAGGEVTVGPATVIGGGVSLTGGRVEFDGSAGKYLQASGGTVRLNGEVQGDAEVRAEDLVIEPGTRISGKLVYRGPEAPVVPEGAVIAGGVEFRERAARHVVEDAGREVHVGEQGHGAGTVLWLAGVFVAAALFLLLFPGYARAAAAAIGRAPLQSIGLGLAIVVCVPFVIVVLLITIIGIPLALLMIPLYLLVLFLGWVTAALFLAQRGLEALRPGQPAGTAGQLLALFLGLLALWLVGKVPFVGDLLVFVALLAGIGALTWRLWNGRAAAPAGA